MKSFGIYFLPICRPQHVCQWSSRVPDRILLDGLVLSDPLPPIGILLAAPLVAEGLPYIRPHPVIPV